MPSKRRLTETEPSADSADAPSDPSPNLPPPGQQQAPVKRQRVSRACDQCRAARERCDGKQPECQPCINQSRPCTYEVSPKKRGVQTGYIRTLELALGCIFERIPGSEDTLTSLLTREKSQGHLVLTGKDPGEADRLQKTWRQSRAHRVIERILSGEAPPSPDLNDTSPLAETTELDRHADGHSELAVSNHSEAPLHRNPIRASTSSQGPPPTPSDAPTAAATPGLTPPDQILHHGPRRLKLPADHWRLLDVYFSYTYSWLPILEKQVLFQASYLYPDNGLIVDPSDPSSAVHAELWAALAVAACQDAAGPKRSPDGQSATSASSPSSIYNIARGLLPGEDGPFQVNHARALVLLSLVNLAQGKLSGAGLLIGSAIRILFDLDPTPGVPPMKPAGQATNLTWMACFIIDAILSISRRRPQHLRPEHLDALPLAPENGPDQWEPWTACEGFGVGSTTGSRASRSPAFCSITFNALYSIIQAVVTEASLSGRGLPEKLDGLHNKLLDLAAGPGSPFREFVASPTCGTISAPTPYIVRAMYFWTSALAEPYSETPLSALQETLDSFQRQFGRHGIPPIISVALSSLTNDEFLLRCNENSRRRVGVLVSSYSAPWQSGDRASSGLGRSPSISSLQPSQGHLASPARSSLSHSPVIHFPTPNMSSFFGRQPSTTPRHEAPESSRTFDSFLTPTVTGSYPFPDDPTGIATTQGGELAAQMRPHARQSSIPAAISGSLAGPTPMPGLHHRNHPSTSSSSANALISPSAFGTSPDFDALLDDLASIEGVDAVDADAQFMTNLGFAPGCDITEILTRGFGGA